MMYKNLDDNIRKTTTEEEWLEKLYKIKDYNVRDVSLGDTPLTVSANYGHIEGCKHILNSGGDINLQNRDGETPIHCTIDAIGYYGDSTFLFLLDKGADINIADNDKVTPFMKAIRYNLSPILIQLLIDKGANVNAKNKWKKTPLMYAAETRDITIYNTLLEKGADPFSLDYEGCNALYYLTKIQLHTNEKELQMNMEEIIELLPQDQPSLNIINSETGDSILHHAATNGYLKLTKRLLKNNVEINKQNIKGETSIIRACKREQYKIIELLLKYNANVNLKDNDNNSVITLAQKYANQNGDNRLEEILIQYNIELPLKLGEVDVNEVDKKGNTVLHFAVKDGSLEKVKELIERGVNVNFQNKQGKTALMLASVKFGCADEEEKMKLLLRNGAHVNLQDNYGKTALIYLLDCNSYGYTETVRNKFNLLMSVKNIDANLQTNIGMTVLMYVCKLDYQEVSYYVKALIDKGAKVSLTTKKGKTALSFVSKWDVELQEFLKAQKDS